MALAVTVLLSFTVYLGIISDNMPKTSESLSLLGQWSAKPFSRDGEGGFIVVTFRQTFVVPLKQ